MFNDNFISITDRNKKNIFSNFLNESMNSEVKEKKLEQKSFHEIIRKDKDILYKLYSDKSFFKEILPQLIKTSRDRQFYNNIIRKDIKKTYFFKDILKQIEKMNKEKAQRLKSKLYHKKIKYNIHDLERIKKKQNYLSNKIFINSNFFRRNNSFINKKLDINETSKNIGKEKIKNRNNSQRIYKDIKNHFFDNDKLMKLNKSNSEKSIFKENRILKFNNIIKLCKGQIKLGKNVGKKFESYNNKISENIKEIIKKESKENKKIQDQQMLGKEVADNNEKNIYKKKEVEYYNDMKKNLDRKISDVYAYFNRKEFNKQIKDKDTYKAYEFYLKDINEINLKLANKKKIEKKKINKIKILLEDIYKGKEYLKNKINEYKEKYENLKNIENDIQYNLNNKEENITEKSGFDIFEPPPNVNINKNKIVLPKLLIKRVDNDDI